MLSMPRKRSKLIGVKDEALIEENTPFKFAPAIMCSIKANTLAGDEIAYPK